MKIVIPGGSGQTGIRVRLRGGASNRVASPQPLAWGRRLGLTSPEWMIEIGALLMRTESE